MATHGRLVRMKGDNLVCDDIVLSPTALETSSAAAMFAGLRQVLPSSIWRILVGDLSRVQCKRLAICTGCDHAASNLKLIAHLEGLAPDAVLFLPGLCKHHAAGLCLAGLTKDLKVACPTFCVAKLIRNDKFYRRVQAGIREALQQDLDLLMVEDLSLIHI